MMPAAKHGDPEVGIDIHLCIVPPGQPTPLPTPHMSIVFDPFDYVPFLGATVTVCGMKRATAGTNAKVIHIPPGFPFAPLLPESDDELFMGSATVIADGDPMSHVSHPVLGCHVAGMVSPPRLKKKNTNFRNLPTTFNLAIPTSVFVGGPPTISLMGMAFKAGFALLGRFARSGLFARARRWAADRLNLKHPGFWRCRVFRAEPVSILNGSVSVEQLDFTLPGRLPIEWARNYRSDNANTGVCGRGWETLADTRMEISAEDGLVHVHCPTFGLLTFLRLPTGVGQQFAELEFMDGSLLVDHGDEYRITTNDNKIYHFSKERVSVDNRGQQRWPIDKITDHCGNAITFEYRSGRIASITESAGRRLDLTIEHDRLKAITLIDPATSKEHTFVRYEYDQNGDLLAAIDALGSPYCFAYDQRRLVRHTDRNGLSFYYDYAESEEDDWRVVHAWGDGGLYDYRFEYFDAINERRITDSLGNVSTVKLNEDGLPISEIDALGGMTIYEYDDVGRTTAVVDLGGNRTEYEYDERGNLLKLTRPDGKTIQTEFNENNKAIKITDPNGAEWQQTWNDSGGLVSQVSPLGAQSHYEYDAYGQLIGFKNPREALTQLTFDHQGNLTRLNDALGHATRFEYDFLGNVTGKHDPMGHKTRYQYDQKGRLLKAILPSGAAIACAYDHEDNLICYVDENGAETRLEYFGQGEIKRRIQPDGHAVEYHYDTEEQLIGVTNQRGETYQLKRDALGRIVEEVDYWGQSRRYTYTEAGYLKKSADPLGRVIHYETDPLGRIVKKLLPDAIQTESFEYDANGNLVACENAAIRIERCFDDEGHLLEEKQGEACTITNAYDLNGNRLARGIEVNIGERRYISTVHYRFDALDQAIKVEKEGHDPLTLARNALGQVTEETLSKSLRRDFAYSPDGYLTAQRVFAGEGPLFEQNYHYDRAGNLLEKRDSVMGIDQYTYDPLGRLVSHLNPEGRLTKYFNDPAGDRLRTYITGRVSDENTLDGWGREGEYEGIYYRFDRAGNLIERSDLNDESRFSWDANQRLIESSTNDKITTYQYDPLGRRVRKETDDIITGFFWDGDALLGDMLVEEGKSGALATARLREWVYYPETFEPLIMTQNDGTSASELYLYHNDPNGCPTRLLDVAGDVVWAAQYNAWGGVERLLVDRVDNPIRLQGQYWDDETSLCHNRARYYDPAVGQFVSQDIIGILAGTNVYSFAPNMLKWIDPLGLSCEMVDLYRAVSPEELADILGNRRFRPRPGGMSLDAKQFGRSLDETIALADHLPDTAAIVRARVPADIVSQMDLTPVDRTILRSGSVTVQPDKLDIFNDSIVELEHVF